MYKKPAAVCILKVILYQFSLWILWSYNKTTKLCISDFVLCTVILYENAILMLYCFRRTRLIQYLYSVVPLTSHRHFKLRLTVSVNFNSNEENYKVMSYSYGL